MSALKPGTRCVIIAGCPENIGLIVEVIGHLGRYGDRKDAYEIKTLTRKPFNQVWHGKALVKGNSRFCVTDRHKLRPLVDPEDDSDNQDIELPIKQIDYIEFLCLTS